METTLSFCDKYGSQYPQLCYTASSYVNVASSLVSDGGNGTSSNSSITSHASESTESESSDGDYRSFRQKVILGSAAPVIFTGLLWCWYRRKKHAAPVNGMELLPTTLENAERVESM